MPKQAANGAASQRARPSGRATAPPERRRLASGGGGARQ